jgi:hypothetical protein
MSKRALFLLTAFFACGASTQEQNRQPSDFVGTWVGKWDNKWCVQFTITSDPGVTNATVLYEVEGLSVSRSRAFAGWGRLTVDGCKFRTPSSRSSSPKPQVRPWRLAIFPRLAPLCLFGSRRAGAVQLAGRSSGGA